MLMEDDDERLSLTVWHPPSLRHTASIALYTINAYAFAQAATSTLERTLTRTS